MTSWIKYSLRSVPNKEVGSFLSCLWKCFITAPCSGLLLISEQREDCHSDGNPRKGQEPGWF